jgi:hypothetical protein
MYDVDYKQRSSGSTGRHNFVSQDCDRAYFAHSDDSHTFGLTGGCKTKYP